MTESNNNMTFAHQRADMVALLSKSGRVLIDDDRYKTHWSIDNKVASPMWTSLISPMSKMFFDPEVPRLLHQYGFDFNEKDPDGNTLLALLALEEDIIKIKLLAGFGVDLEARNNNGITALMAAAWLGNIDVIEALVKAGANLETRSTMPDESTDGQYTALIQAARNGKASSVRKLVELGANVNVRCSLNGTALTHAITDTVKLQDLLTTMRELIVAGIDIVAVDAYGDTAVTRAVALNDIAVVKELLKHGAVYDRSMIDAAQTPEMQALLHRARRFYFFLEVLWDEFSGNFSNPSSYVLWLVPMALYFRNALIHYFMRVLGIESEAQRQVRTSLHRDKLNQLTQLYTNDASWDADERHQLTLQFSKENITLQQLADKCQLSAAQVHEALVTVLRSYYPKLISDAENLSIHIHISQETDATILAIDNKAVTQALDSLLNKQWLASDEYKTLLGKELLAAIIERKTQVTKRLFSFNNNLEEADLWLEAFKTHCDKTAKNLDDYLKPLSRDDARTIARLKKPLEALEKYIDMGKSANNDDAKKLKKDLQSTAQAIIDLENEIKFNVHDDELDAIKDKFTPLEEKLGDVESRLRQIKHTFNQKESSIDAAFANVKKQTELHKAHEKEELQRREVLEAEQLKQQALRDEQARRQQERLEAAQRENDQRKLKWEAKKQAQQREREAEPKEEKASSSPPRQSTLNSSGRNSNALFNQRKEKIQTLHLKTVVLGDILQRYDQGLYKYATHVYKYALLVECLRLFEVAQQANLSPVANDIRHMLMHKHRYMDFSMLYQFANELVQKPKKSSDLPYVKLDNLLRQYHDFPGPQHRSHLRDYLQSLTQTTFYQSYQGAEDVSHVAVYLESIEQMLNDLVALEIKPDVDLEKYPDGLAAIKGVMTCIGESLQQWQKLASVAEKKQLNMLLQANEELKGFCKDCTRLRSDIGHSMTEDTFSPTLLKQYWAHAGAMRDAFNMVNVDQHAHSASTPTNQTKSGRGHHA